ncbi:hypothetical protein [Herbaspirillum seropedicae]|uniref:hypothetical protein n=1 Tax=Herbaspirillum seropedicae TaxID=964 RepID=UPI0012EAF33A|nr:hypothetical protein [Herbaspirillum seropedicae]
MSFSLPAIWPEALYLYVSSGFLKNPEDTKHAWLLRHALWLMLHALALLLSFTWLLLHAWTIEVFHRRQEKNVKRA